MEGRKFRGVKKIIKKKFFFYIFTRTTKVNFDFKTNKTSRKTKKVGDQYCGHYQHQGAQ